MFPTDIYFDIYTFDKDGTMKRGYEAWRDLSLASMVISPLRSPYSPTAAEGAAKTMEEGAIFRGIQGLACGLGPSVRRGVTLTEHVGSCCGQGFNAGD